MTNNKPLKTRISALEQGKPDDPPEIRVNWGDSDPSELKPGDKLITWDQNDEIRSYVIGRDRLPVREPSTDDSEGEG